MRSRLPKLYWPSLFLLVVLIGLPGLGGCAANRIESTDLSFDESVDRPPTAKTIYNSLLDVGGLVDISDRDVVVTLDKRAHNPFLVDSGLQNERIPMSWLGGRELEIRFA